MDRYAKIKPMKASLPHYERESYLRHRRQRTAQVILPVVLAALVFVTLGVLAIVSAARGTGDVAKWGATASIMIIMPLLIMALIFALVLSGMAYLLARLLGILPVYTGKLQELIYKLEAYIRRIADAVVKPVFGIDEIGATLKALIGRR